MKITFLAGLAVALASFSTIAHSEEIIVKPAEIIDLNNAERHIDKLAESFKTNWVKEKLEEAENLLEEIENIEARYVENPKISEMSKTKISQRFLQKFYELRELRTKLNDRVKLAVLKLQYKLTLSYASLRDPDKVDQEHIQELYQILIRRASQISSMIVRIDQATITLAALLEVSREITATLIGGPPTKSATDIVVVSVYLNARVVRANR